MGLDQPAVKTSGGTGYARVIGIQNFPLSLRRIEYALPFTEKLRRRSPMPFNPLFNDIDSARRFLQQVQRMLTQLPASDQTSIMFMNRRFCRIMHGKSPDFSQL